MYLECLSYVTLVESAHRWDPSRRMSPDEALTHEWVKEGMVHRARGVPRNSKRTRAANQSSVSEKKNSQQDPHKTSQGLVKGQWIILEVISV